MSPEINCIDLNSLFLPFFILHRIACSPRTFLIPPPMFTGLVLLETLTAPHAANAGMRVGSGSVIVPDIVEVETPTQAGIQRPGSLLRKFPSLNLRPRLHGRGFISFCIHIAFDAVTPFVYTAQIETEIETRSF